jgi:2,3-bisphosphoglycerate-independent phosphoglycerate mutase
MDDVVRFDEYRCAQGGLNRIRGCDLIPMALDLINRAHKFGA